MKREGDIANIALTQRLPGGNGTRKFYSHFLSLSGSHNPTELRGGWGSPTASWARKDKRTTVFFSDPPSQNDRGYADSVSFSCSIVVLH